MGKNQDIIGQPKQPLEEVKELALAKVRVLACCVLYLQSSSSCMTANDSVWFELLHLCAPHDSLKVSIATKDSATQANYLSVTGGQFVHMLYLRFNHDPNRILE